MASEHVIVELTDGDLPTVVRLCGESLDLPEDAAEAEPIVHRLRAAGPGGQPLDGFRPGTAGGVGRTVGFLALTSDGDVRGAVLGSVDHTDPAVGHVDLVAVRPAHRRRGVGRALLLRVEQALARLGATTVRLAGNPPRYAWPGIDVRYTPAVCLALAAGYSLDRTAWNMTVDLSEPDAPALRDDTVAERRLAARGVAVRRASPDDVPALVDFVRPTFAANWATEVADSVTGPDAGCHLAERDGELLGFAAYGSSRPSWFGPMGTAPAARGLGIGGLLLRRCLRDQYAAGQRRVQIGWVGPVPFYAREAGARIERVFLLYRKAG